MAEQGIYVFLAETRKSLYWHSQVLLEEPLRRTRLDLIELFSRDDVAIYNSIPTAEGALFMAIQHTDITIHGSRCMVLGLGRIGLTLAGMLHRLGAHVKAGVLKPEQFARAWEMGIEPFYTKDLYDEGVNVDIIFNTVPEQILTSRVLTRIPHHTIIIDLASKPGGTDFRFAEKRGIKALLAPSLPGLVAPRTAGRILARTLCQLIQDERSQNREQMDILACPSGL
ncbi:dipicolinate synthase subunit DpsA [Paenibacillus cellulositrophicus]|uniref:dipicolinate synthase subunit DpsA n=1 Tax=Paenibacillus cellulositrophicus TaxID=562959 RepID=UPI003F81B87F